MGAAACTRSATCRRFSEWKWSASSTRSAPASTVFAVGDRVAYPMNLGAYAEARLIDADKLVRIPDSISDETAAAMMLKGLTAHYLLFRTYPVQAGDSILAYAAAGGVASILCQWANMLGA